VRLTHCPHIDGLRIPTGHLSDCALSTTDVNKVVGSHVEKLVLSWIHHLSRELES